MAQHKFYGQVEAADVPGAASDAELQAEITARTNQAAGFQASLEGVQTALASKVSVQINGTNPGPGVLWLRTPGSV